jgi:hypothetical protein
MIKNEKIKIQMYIPYFFIILVNLFSFNMEFLIWFSNNKLVVAV